MPQSRQLAAIMFTDIVGYTALMGNDEQRAFTLLNKNRQLQKPIIGAFDGRWIKEIGDGTMASFNTVSDAVNAAIKIQEACNAANDFQLRIGIHQGEVVFENDDVFGDAVNIASRIESLGIAGSVLISKAIRDQVKNKSDFHLESLGYFDFKNVSEPMEVFALTNPGFAVPKREEMQGKLKLPPKKSSALRWIILVAFITAASFAIWFFMGQKKASVDTGDQSIAVLAFVDMSQAKDQEYFSDGLSENVIDLLAKVPSLKVIGRTSSFSFKGKNEDLRVIGEKLGVANILEGSVQRDGNKLRVTAQLIRCADGFHLWSEKFDRELEDIFAIQDEISLAILSAIKIKLFGAEKKAVLKKYTDNVEAYQLYLQGRFHMNKFTPDGFFKAIEYFDAAITIDSAYSIAFADKAFCYMNLSDFGWQTGEKIKSQALEAAQQAIRLDDEIAESHMAMGRIKLHWDWKIREAKMSFEKALAINPNHAQAHIQLGFCKMFLGNDEAAMDHARIAESLDPFSLLNRYYIFGIQVYTRHFDELLKNGKKMIDLEPNFPGGYLAVGNAMAYTGSAKEALPEFEKAVKLQNSTLSLANLGFTYGMMGEKAKALEVIEKMKNVGATGHGGNYLFGNVYASIRELDSAFAYYDKAIEGREAFALWIRMFVKDVPEFWEDPRAELLMEKIGLPNK